MFPRPWRPAAIAVVLACSSGGPATVEHVLDAAAYDALPLLVVEDGAKLCEADGYTNCPLRSPVANWLNGESYVLWEPGKRVGIFGAGHPEGLFLDSTASGEGKYGYAVAAGPDGNGVAVVDESGRLIRYRRNGEPAGEVTMPVLPPGSDRGFAGSVLVLQRLNARLAGDGESSFELRLLSGPSDAEGIEAVQLPLPWLELARDSSVTVPFFVSMPRFAVGRNREVVWSPGDSFEIHRMRPGRATPLWTTRIPGRSTAVTPDELTQQRQLLLEQFASQVDSATADSMVSRASKTHPAISGLLLDPEGQVLVAPGLTPTRDSVEFLLLSPDGSARARLRMASTWRPLIFAGDSVLVHRPTEGETKEVVWIQLKAPL